MSVDRSWQQLGTELSSHFVRECHGFVEVVFSDNGFHPTTLRPFLRTCAVVQSLSVDERRRLDQWLVDFEARDGPRDRQARPVLGLESRQHFASTADYG